MSVLLDQATDSIAKISHFSRDSLTRVRSKFSIRINHNSGWDF